MTNETKNVPELRFPGFEGEWVNWLLGDLCDFSNGINAKKDQYGTGRKFINVLDVLNNNFINYSKIVGRVSVTEKVEQNNKVEYGDILFLRSSETREDVGISNIYLDNEFALFGGFVIRGKKKSKYNPMFIKLYLNNSKMRYEIGSLAGGSTRFNISQDVLKKVILKLPTLDEQQKIGDFFSKLDQQIELEEKKLALLEKQKKGYMQKIFSQELRFKDENGNEYPEWEEVKIGEVLKERNERNSEGQLLSVTINSGIRKFDNQSRKDNSSKDKANYKQVYKNDIAYNSMRMWQGASGRSEYDGIVSPAYTVVYPIPNVSSLFISYYFKTYILIHLFRINSQGLTSDTWNLKYKQLKDIKIKICCESEQNKIGDFLKLIDESIESQRMKLDLLKNRKNGYLQKMFV
nr:restriction endonuclease subunit S [Mammaliicoccus sp. Marseille-Q6498]